MDDETLPDNRSPISEERIRQISRTIRSFVPSSAATATPTHSEQIKEFEYLLDHVLQTSAYATLGTTHRVSAWNTLCSLIDQGLESNSTEVREVIWKSNTWNRALDLYLFHAQDARPKSARQLLVTLTGALKKAPLDAQEDLKHLATQRLVRCLLDFQDPFQAKASAQLLSHILVKDVVDIENVLLSFCEGQSAVPTASIDVRAAAVLETLFGWLGKGDFGSTIAQLLSAVLDKLPAKDSSKNPIWASPLEKAYLRNSANVDDLRAHIFPILFKRSFEDFAAFLQSQDLDQLLQAQDVTETSGARSSELIFAALQTGKELGILLETEDHQVTYAPPAVLVPLQLIGRLLLQRSPSARLAGLSLLISSHSVTRPLSLAALNLARRTFSIYFASVDQDFRSEVFSAFSRLIDRIRAVTAVLARQAAQQKTQSPDSTAPSTVFDFHQAFVKRIIRFLTGELRPTASYQRHISALKCIQILARSGLDEAVPAEFYSKSAQGETKWAFHIPILTKDLQRLLLDILMDPFDDVRATASAIMGYYCSVATNGGVLQQPQLSSTLERAESMMLATGRADHADGVAHLYSICYRRCGADFADLTDSWSSRQAFFLQLVEKLERMLVSAKENLGEAVQKYPMHGLLTSLRYVLQQDQGNAGVELQSRLFEYLRRVWDVVKPVLCNDAPEGFIPEELEDSPESTKESLSYCWRALKEASLLLSSLISTQPVTGDTNTIQQMSRLCFTQLAELRHRGAFSTVAQTWQSCCMRCKDLRDPSGSLMLEIWYTNVLDILRNNVTINTRRSAGLPSLLCGILVADKSGTLLTRAFADLETIARKDVDVASAEEGSLAQVHAMNCLKDVLKNTRLGEQTQHQVPVALQLAADALRSEVWAVRNCGLMLFRAVIDRLLGTNESLFEEDVVFQKRISAEQHPALLDVVLGLLPQPSTAQASSMRYESVFPALQLLQHTRIPSERLEETRIAVRAMTASPAWHVRDKAARTLASLVDRNQSPPRLFIFVMMDSDRTSQNALHGALLALKYIMAQAKRASTTPAKRNSDNNFPDEDYIEVVERVADIYNATPSVVTKAACVDCLRECCAFLSQRADNNRLNDHHTLFCSFADASLQDQGAASVFAHLLSQCLYDTSSAVLRQAWARYAAHHIATYKLGTTKEADIFLHALFELAHCDNDATSYFVETSNWTEMINGGKGALVVQLCTKLLASEDLNIGLKCEALRTLLTLLTRNPSNWVPELREALRIATKDQLSVGKTDNNQAYVDLLLQLQAVAFESSNTIQDVRTETDHLVLWSNDCIAAVTGRGLHTREAAAEALDRLYTTWSLLGKEKDTAKAFRGLLCAVYDLLNDDDEDIRLLAAGVTSRILSRATDWKDVDLEPIVAGQRLLALYNLRAAGSSEALPHEMYYALNRAYNLSSGVAAVPVTDQLATMSHSDTALFAEEKQNLYIDDSQEARVWPQVTTKLLAAKDPPSSPVEFIEWVSNGLDALARQAEGKPDGALGWSASEDVFALGLKVILGSEVVLQMKSRGVPVPALEPKLFACAKAFENAEVNCLWRWEVERILSDAVMGNPGKLNSSTVKRYQVGA